MTWLQLLDAFGASRFLAHSYCLTNDPIMLLSFTAVELITALSYFAIGAALLLEKAFPIQRLTHTRVLFGAFIFLCGLSHLTEIATLYAGVYRLDIVVSALMAGVSAATAWRVISARFAAP